VYVVVQFIWWGYHLIELTKEVAEESVQITNRITMIVGEGSVFLLFVLIGVWQIRRAIKKELQLSEKQNNFLLSVTHELKTPLAANKLYIQTITKREMTKEQTDEILTKAIEENIRLEGMIDNILNASRLENNALAMEKEIFSLSELVVKISKRFNALLGNDLVKIEDSGNITINADKFMIETILNNLIENSLKYAGIQDPISLYIRKGEKHLQFGVVDSGPGVPDEFKTEIFNKFFRVGNEETRTQKGSGLGLFIVDQFVKLHKGTVTCIDNNSTGINFQINFSDDA
jgi:K+-sensing histidine kinase KdpD